jgi:hypothetical protein
MSDDVREEVYERFADDDEVVRAAQDAVRRTLAEHRRKGQQVVVWRDGRPVRVNLKATEESC